MRRGHFETLRPVCPRCRRDAGRAASLTLAAVEREEADHVVEGALHCTDAHCMAEYPILDGIPILVPDARAYVVESLERILARDDLSAAAESLVGDCAGPGSAFDVTRQHLSNYARDHYGDLDPDEEDGAPAPGSVLRCLDEGLRLAGDVPSGPVLDLGCSVGRSTFALAERCGGPVLGVDLHYAMLRLAGRVLRHGEVAYPRRRVGVVYDRRRFSAPFEQADDVDFWACDALALPFEPGGFAFTSALNLLDCVTSPLDLIGVVGDQLRPGGAAVLSVPYDWSPAATAFEAWIGGHSQRGPLAGAAEPLLRSLLTPGAHPRSSEDLVVIGETERFPWHVRLHERSTMTYDAHVLAVRKAARPTTNP